MKKQEQKKTKNKLLLILFGAIIGLINGLFGGGGGMVCVPVLIYLAAFPVKKAHATAIAVILPLSVISGLMYFTFFDIEWNVALYTGIGVFAGGIAGAFLLKKIPNKIIVLLFSGLMVAAGVKLLFF